jgi:hypothetical protein
VVGHSDVASGQLDGVDTAVEAQTSPAQRRVSSAEAGYGELDAFRGVGGDYDELFEFLKVVEDEGGGGEV